MIVINRDMKPYFPVYNKDGFLINPPPYYHPFKGPERDESGRPTGRMIPFPNNHERRKQISMAGRRKGLSNITKKKSR